MCLCKGNNKNVRFTRYFPKGTFSTRTIHCEECKNLVWVSLQAYKNPEKNWQMVTHPEQHNETFYVTPFEASNVSWYIGQEWDQEHSKEAE